MKRRIAIGCGVAILLVLCLKVTPLLSAQASTSTGVTTIKLADGLVVEEVKVAGSCVVVVSRGGPGPKSEGVVFSGNVAAVPCRP
jgi:hypothetical protein